MICAVCHKNVTHLIRGKYCSFACEKRDAPPKAPPKKTSGSRARHIRIRHMLKRYSAEDWARALAYFDNRCAYCGEPNKHLQQEHFMPVQFGGTYTPDNIIPACAKCNGAKSDKEPFEWLVVQEHGLARYAKITPFLDAQKNF